MARTTLLSTTALTLCIAIALVGCKVSAPGEVGAKEPGTGASSQIASSESMAATQSGALEQISGAFVEEVMRTQYGDAYDAGNKCWRHEIDLGAGGGETTYCMQPGKSYSVAGGIVYLSAHNISDVDADQPEYMYGMQDPGVFGAFKVLIDADGSLKDIVASNPGMTYGTAGNCGCENAEFQQIGQSTYAWIFTSGGTWQGQSVLAYSIVADRNGTFQDVAAIPRTIEEEEDVVYELKIDKAAGGKMFPLLVSKTKRGKSFNENRIAFDTRSGTYELKR